MVGVAPGSNRNRTPVVGEFLSPVTEGRGSRDAKVFRNQSMDQDCPTVPCLVSEWLSGKTRITPMFFFLVSSLSSRIMLVLSRTPRPSTWTRVDFFRYWSMLSYPLFLVRLLGVTSTIYALHVDHPVGPLHSTTRDEILSSWSTRGP